MLKKYIRVMCLLLVLCLTAGMAACGGSDEKTLTQADGTQAAETEGVNEIEPAETALKIGILKFDADSAENAAAEGFLQALAAAGYENGKNMAVTTLCANGTDGYASLAETLAKDGADLIFALTPRCARAVSEQTHDIPVVFACVGDPLSEGLVQDADAPGGNLTGVADPAPVKEQIALIKTVFPEAKTVAVLYGDENADEASRAKAEIEALGMTCAPLAAASVTGAVEQLKAPGFAADAIYLPAGSDTFNNSLAYLANTAAALGLGLFTADAASVQKGGLASCDTDYLALGKQAGETAAKLLSAADGAAEAGKTPVKTADSEAKIYLNADAAKTLGVTFPEDLLADAVVYPDNE